jgi:hypothetical protein
MRLAKDRFYKGQFNFRRDEGGEMESVPLYTYETHNALYDVVVLDGAEYVRTNMGAWSNRIDAWHRIHYAIRSHFGIGEAV